MRPTPVPPPLSVDIAWGNKSLPSSKSAGETTSREGILIVFTLPMIKKNFYGFL